MSEANECVEFVGELVVDGDGQYGVHDGQVTTWLQLGDTVFFGAVSRAGSLERERYFRDHAGYLHDLSHYLGAHCLVFRCQEETACA